MIYLCSSYDPSYTIFSWLNFMIIFNIASADFVVMSADAILKMTIKLSQLKIGSLLGRTLLVSKNVRTFRHIFVAFSDYMIFIY